MPNGKKGGIGLAMVGFSFVVVGCIFLSGKPGVGVSILVAGLVFIAAAVATAHKAPPPDGRSGTQPPSEGGRGGA